MHLVITKDGNVYLRIYNNSNNKITCIDIIKDIIYQLNNSAYNANAMSIFDFSKKKWDLTRMHVVLLAKCLDSVRQSEI